MDSTTAPTPNSIRALTAHLRTYLPALRVDPRPAREGGAEAGFLVGITTDAVVSALTPLYFGGPMDPQTNGQAVAKIIAGYVSGRNHDNAREDIPTPTPATLAGMPDVSVYTAATVLDGPGSEGITLGQMLAELCEGTGAEMHANTLARALRQDKDPAMLAELAVAATGLDLDDVPGTVEQAREAVTLGLVALPNVERLSEAAKVLSGPVALRVPEESRDGLDALLTWIAWMGGAYTVPRGPQQDPADGEPLPLVSKVPAWRVTAQN